MTLDLSAVTDALIGLVKTEWPTAPIWNEIGTPPANSPAGTQPGPTFTPTFTGLAPDAVRNQPGTQLSTYLYHVEPDNAHESLSWGAQLLGQVGGSATRFLPLALDLYYLLFAYSEVDYHQEHEAMSVALRVFHANPIVRSAPGILPAWELTLTMEHRSYDELSRLWQATTSPLRMSLVYRAAVVFMDPDLAPVPARKTTSFSVSGVGQLPPPAPQTNYPQVFGTSRDSSYEAPGGAVPLASAPACVAAGQTLSLNGSRFGTADASDHVYLLNADGGGEVDVTTWATAAESTASRFLLTLPTSVGTPPADAPEPGVYQLRVGSGTLGAQGSVRSSSTPFSVAAYTDPTGGPVLSGAAPYAVTGAGFLAGATEVFVGTEGLAATAATPGPGQVNVAAAATSLSFSPPTGPPGSVLPLRVRVNGIESDPALWVIL